MARIANDRRQSLLAEVQVYSNTQEPLPGVNTLARRDAFVGQVIESIRRIEFVKLMATRAINPVRADPASDLFDPLKAALIHHRNGNLDEAIWLVFLATHFGRHLRDGWRLVRDVYRGAGQPWTFARLANNPVAFDVWIDGAYAELKGDGVKRRFGNHRKYETLRPDSDRGTNRVLASYVAWVGPNRGHSGLLADAAVASGPDPKALFDNIYQSMDAVTSFGRTARFDFLTMVGKLGLADIEPGIPYLIGATGPLAGARLMFAGSKSAKLRADFLDARVAALGASLGLGMQVMEDSLCNWQKSPDAFVAFRG
jgi:hypothetical protein